MPCAAIVWWGYRRLDGLRQGDRRPLFIALTGFFVPAGLVQRASNTFVLLDEDGVAAGPGGMLGLEAGNLAMRFLGFTGATLLLVSTIAVGWSLFSGMSWLGAAERVGALLEGSYLGIRGHHRNLAGPPYRA